MLSLFRKQRIITTMMSPQKVLAKLMTINGNTYNAQYSFEAATLGSNTLRLSLSQHPGLAAFDYTPVKHLFLSTAPDEPASTEVIITTRPPAAVWGWLLLMTTMLPMTIGHWGSSGIMIVLAPIIILDLMFLPVSFWRNRALDRKIQHALAHDPSNDTDAGSI